MAGYEQQREELEALGVKVYAASVDSEEKTKEVADSGISFPIAHGVTRDDAERLGAWWDGRRNFIQPSEFVVGRGGRILSSTYSSGPIGRLDAGDAIALVKILEARRKRPRES